MRLPSPSVTLATALVAVLVPVAVTGAVSSAGRDAGKLPPANVAPVVEQISDVSLVCPLVQSVKGSQDTSVSAAAPVEAGQGSAGQGSVGAGSISVYPLTPSGATGSAGPVGAALATSVPGSSRLTYAVPVGKPRALVIRATGSAARGLTASVTTRVAAGLFRSLQSEPCTASGSDQWFVGGGAALGRRDVLYVTNLDAAPATVDVTIWTPTGVQRPVPVQGRTIDPGKQYAVAIDALVPGAVATALEVKTRSGRVSSGLYDTQANGLVSQGVDWVPQTAAPAKSAVLAGIPGDDGGQRTLSLLVPGGFDATVNVHLLTTDGTLSPDPLQGLAVQSGQLFSVDLGQAPTSGPFSVVVESDQPVSAGIRTVLPPKAAGQFADFSYSSGIAPSAHRVVLPAASRTATQGTVLQLTAPGSDDVVVAVTTLVASGATTAPPPARLTVPAGTTVQVPVGVLGPAAAAVLVETAPGAAPLYVGWVLAEAGVHGPLVTGGSLPQTPATLLLPAVAADPAVGYPGH